MVRLVLVCVIAWLAYSYLRPERCGASESLICPDPVLEEGVETRLDVKEVCTPRAGYLCKERTTFQVARWALDKGRLRVKIPPPDFLEGDIATRVHQAGIEGIMEWDGHPFPIEISTNRFPLPRWDIRITWTKGLPSQVGHARMRGVPDGKRFEFSVDGLSVVVPPVAGAEPFAMESSGSPAEFFVQAEQAVRGQPLEAVLAQVKATAMHEMGHALGLTHSDQEQDIMYPQYRPNMTRIRVSERDLKTVEALYELPNGAMVQ